MRITHLLGRQPSITLGATALTFTGLAAPAQAPDADPASACLRPEPTPAR